MIEEHGVAHLHLVADEVAGLIVANAEPRNGMVRRGKGVVDGALGGLGLHQPEVRGLVAQGGGLRINSHCAVGFAGAEGQKGQSLQERLPFEIQEPAAGRGYVS